MKLKWKPKKSGENKTNEMKSIMKWKINVCCQKNRQPGWQLFTYDYGTENWRHTNRCFFCQHVATDDSLSHYFSIFFLSLLMLREEEKIFWKWKRMWIKVCKSWNKTIYLRNIFVDLISFLLFFFQCRFICKAFFPFPIKWRKKKTAIIILWYMVGIT